MGEIDGILKDEFGKKYGMSKEYFDELRKVSKYAKKLKEFFEKSNSRFENFLLTQGDPDSPETYSKGSNVVGDTLYLSRKVFPSENEGSVSLYTMEISGLMRSRANIRIIDGYGRTVFPESGGFIVEVENFYKKPERLTHVKDIPENLANLINSAGGEITVPNENGEKEKRILSSDEAYSFAKNLYEKMRKEPEKGPEETIKESSEATVSE